MLDTDSLTWHKAKEYCRYLHNLKRNQLTTLCKIFDIDHSGKIDQLANLLRNHIESPAFGANVNEKGVELLIQYAEERLPKKILKSLEISGTNEHYYNHKYNSNNSYHCSPSVSSSSNTYSQYSPITSSTTSPRNFNANKSPTVSLLSDTIRNRHHNKIINNQPPAKSSQNSSRKNTTIAETNAFHKNKISYSFPELPFYPRAKLLSEPYISPITNKKIKKQFHLLLTKRHYKGLQNKDFKIFFFCGAIPVTIDIDDSDNDFENEDILIGGKHEVIPINFPQAYQFINMRTGAMVERYASSSKKNQKSKPIDVTDLLNKEQLEGKLPLQFSFHFVPAVEFYLSIYLVHAIKTDDLVNQIRQRTKILRNATLYYLKKAHDPENGLQATSITMSLECPISATKIKTPIKSSKCLHIECFDAYWYLESQRQLENNRCPICSKKMNPDDLAISEFAEDILEKCPSNCRRVQLTTNGHWEPLIDSDDDDNDMDSDDDDEGYGFPAAKRQKSSPQRDTTPDTNNNGTTPLQTMNVFPTLDPNTFNTTTPTNNEPLGNLTFSNYPEPNIDSPLSSRCVPNILGSTPLNKNNRKSLPSTKSFNNLAVINSALVDDNSIMENSPSVSVNQDIATVRPMETHNTNSTTTTVHEQLTRTTSNSRVSVLHTDMTKTQVNHPTVPTLPELPKLPLKFVGYGIDKHTDTFKPLGAIQEQQQNHKTTIKPIGKLVVAPFIPKHNKSAYNGLPQKRQISQTNSMPGNRPPFPPEKTQ